MYREEKVINGVLHYRITPTGEWVAFTLVQLTDKIMSKKLPLVGNINANTVTQIDTLTTDTFKM